ncbi:MAG: TIGR03435 family protein [Rudaea sp.]
MKNLVVGAIAVVATAVVLAGQASTPAPAFEVASVKPNNSASTLMYRGGTPNLYEVTNAPLRWLVRSAYGVMDVELAGPVWISSERFDVAAKLPPGTDRQQVPEMLRKLLAERFKLVVHHETRIVATYDLVLGGRNRRLGPNLRKTEIDCAAVVAAAQSGSKPNVALPPQQQGRAPKCGMLEGPGDISLSGAKMKQLSATLSQRLGRRVNDQTGLRDSYDLQLHFAPESATINISDAPGLFTAVQEQLGLKLEPSKGPVDVLVIDHVERPTPD